MNDTPTPTPLNGAIIPHPSAFRLVPDPRPSIQPELHLVIARMGVFQINTRSGEILDFLCLSIPPAPTLVAVHYQPEEEEECSVFSTSVADKRPDDSAYLLLGTGCLLARTTETQQRRRAMLHPSELTQPWRPATDAPEYKLSYLRDAQGLFALGYKSPDFKDNRNGSPGWVIFSGPLKFVPAQFHPAHPATH